MGYAHVSTAKTPRFSCRILRPTTQSEGSVSPPGPHWWPRARELPDSGPRYHLLVERLQVPRHPAHAVSLLHQLSPIQS